MRNRLGFLAVLALLGAAASPFAQAAPAACKVTWSSVRQIEIGDDKLSALVFTGAYEGPAKADFTVMDDDGFLTLAALMNQWQSDGRAAANLTESVELLRNELALLARAARIGTAYQASLLRGGGVNLDEEPAEYEARQEFFRALSADVRPYLVQAERIGSSRIPAGFMRDRLATMLERLAPGSARRIQVYYMEPGKPEAPSAFCDSKAPNALVGQILCSRSFTTGADRPASACAGGIAFNDLNLAALPLIRPPEPAAP